MEVTISQIVFYAFACIAIVSASFVVFSANPVRSALSLVMTFFATSAIWMLLESEFLAITLVLVYVGAVMVLFLFVVMMIDLEQAYLKKMCLKHIPVMLLVAGTFALFLLWLINHKHMIAVMGDGALTPRPLEYSSIVVLGKTLFTQYLLAFEVAGVILLVAIVAAITLTFRGKRIGNKALDPDCQIRVNKSDRLKIVDMAREPKKGL